MKHDIPLKVNRGSSELLDARSHDPLAVLGPHAAPDGALVRLFDPHARRIELETRDGPQPFERVHPAGIYESHGREWSVQGELDWALLQIPGHAGAQAALRDLNRLYREPFNSDAAVYGGSDMGNGGAVRAREGGWGGFPYTLELALPPLAGLILAREH